MTRIYGYDAIGRKQFMVIPIGGKSVTGVGELLTNRIESFRQAVTKEYSRHPDRPSLRDIANARLNPESGAIENLEILFFSTRLNSSMPLELPIQAALRLAG